ncbi:hypothetical protein [Bradyrhizobium liaoningense]|uniref:hypothetical protein n=1 Tax=Bradyrhizobium liaoningense TaxID=43992 RepID=UPI001BA62308|nr:hypothetical protein [Bradyrhizobium liaoningense]MBR0946121.1 hypothetical protein [Bradyrhizobium liaoningense]
MSEKLVDYCSRHRISFDWRLDGRLKGLKKMIDERREVRSTFARGSGDRHSWIRRILDERDQRSGVENIKNSAYWCGIAIINGYRRFM